MHRIKLLDPSVTNKIAAGEVIERPSSIVKELIENSVDAMATSISVEVENGGLKHIGVVDNGMGIQPEDMELAVLKHATSKISTVEDLNSIYSMGFRGEALSSIGAVSMLKIKSQTKDASIGKIITVEGGKILSQEDKSLPLGTSVSVDHLFYNIPARFKFVKNPGVEAAHISDLVSRLILAYKDISIRYSANGKLLYKSPGSGELMDAIVSVYKSGIVEKLIPVDYEYMGIKVKGYVGKPFFNFKSSRYQTVIVNKRFVKSDMVKKAVLTAYGERLLKGCKPFFVLNITLSPSEIDVNVHPRKLDIQFLNKQKVEYVVHEAVYEALGKNSHLKQMKLHPPVRKEANSSVQIAFEGNTQEKFLTSRELESLHKAQQEKEFVSFAHVDSEAQNSPSDDQVAMDRKGLSDAEFTNPDTFSPEIFGGLADKEGETEVANHTLDVKAEKQETESVPEMESGLSLQELLAASKAPQPLPDFKGDKDMHQYINYQGEGEGMPIGSVAAHWDGHQPDATANTLLQSAYRIIGVAFQTYILVECEESLFLIDQHAAHERLIYEEFKAQLQKNIPSQLLLFPQEMGLTHENFDLLMKNKEVFEELGFSFVEGEEAFTIRITSLPAILGQANGPQLIDDLLEQIRSGGGDVVAKKERMIRASCRSAIKAGDLLPKREIERLLDSLLRQGVILHCPHGRPIIIQLKREEIEKYFSRRV